MIHRTPRWPRPVTRKPSTPAPSPGTRAREARTRAPSLTRRPWRRTLGVPSRDDDGDDAAGGGAPHAGISGGAPYAGIYAARRRFGRRGVRRLLSLGLRRARGVPVISRRLRIKVSGWLLRVLRRAPPAPGCELHRRAVRRRLRQERGHRLLRLLRSARRRVDFGVVTPSTPAPAAGCWWWRRLTPRRLWRLLLRWRRRRRVIPRIRGRLLLVTLTRSHPPNTRRRGCGCAGMPHSHPLNTRNCGCCCCRTSSPAALSRFAKDPVAGVAILDRAPVASTTGRCPIPRRTRRVRTLRLARLVRVQTLRLGRRQTFKPLSQTVRDIGSVRARPVRHRLHRRHLRVGLRRRGHGWRRSLGQHSRRPRGRWRRRVGRRHGGHDWRLWRGRDDDADSAASGARASTPASWSKKASSSSTMEANGFVCAATGETYASASKSSPPPPNRSPSDDAFLTTNVCAGCCPKEVVAIAAGLDLDGDSRGESFPPKGDARCSIHDAFGSVAAAPVSGPSGDGGGFDAKELSSDDHPASFSGA